MTEYITVEAMANAVGRRRNTIRERIYSGKLPAVWDHIRHIYLIPSNHAPNAETTPVVGIGHSIVSGNHKRSMCINCGALLSGDETIFEPCPKLNIKGD